MSNIINEVDDEFKEKIYEDNIRIKPYKNLEKRLNNFLLSLIISFILLFFSFFFIIKLYYNISSLTKKLSSLEKSKFIDPIQLSKKINSLSKEVETISSIITKNNNNSTNININSSVNSENILSLTNQVNQNKKEIGQLKNEVLLLSKSSNLNYISSIYKVKETNFNVYRTHLFNPVNFDLDDEECIVIIDGEIQHSIQDTYVFYSPGEHYVTFAFKGKFKSIYGLFDGCEEIIEIDLSKFISHYLISVQRFCRYCISLRAINLKNFDTSSIEDYYKMFQSCESLTSIDLRRFNTTNAKIFNSLFYGCSSLVQLDLSSFDTSNAYNMWYMFSEMKNLRYLDIRNFNVKNIDIIDNMFEGTGNINNSSIVIVNSSNNQQLIINAIYDNLPYWNIVDLTDN